MAYRLLEQFGATFTEGPYRHRDSSLGNKIANYLYDDLYEVAKSRLYNERVDMHTRVLNRSAKSPGVRARRGDGSFGEIIPSAVAIAVPGYVVASGPTATIEIGAEVKLLSKAMIKQIDRVISDLRNQAEQFKRKNPDVITVGLVGVNNSEYVVSYEGDRAFRTDGRRYPHPFQEADEAKRRLQVDAEPAFDEFLMLDFSAINEPPYPFRWVGASAMEAGYGAALLRILRRYESRFP